MQPIRNLSKVVGKKPQGWTESEQEMSEKKTLKNLTN